MSSPWDHNTYVATIIDHHDGDTSHCAVSLGLDVIVNITVRWAGIDAPEIGTPEGKEAVAYVRAILPEGSSCEVRTVKDHKEKYGRSLGTFISDGVNINQAMVTAGHAKAYDGGTR